MKKDIACLCVMALSLFALSACAQTAPTANRLQSAVSPQLNENAEPALPDSTAPDSNQDGMYLGQTAVDHAGSGQNKLCYWVDSSDIIIKLGFAPGVEKDISYEAGFFFSPTYSSRRLARSGCDYRVGFSFDELKGKGAAELGAIGYSDNRRRIIQDAPVSVFLGEDGVPDKGRYFEITIMD